jgi:integrase
MNNRVTALSVSRLQKPGRHRVDDGLYLQVRNGARGKRKTWVFRFQLAGKPHMLGLGRYPHITLEEARGEAFELQRMLTRGVDPLQHKRTAARLNQAHSTTFKDCAEKYLQSHATGWGSRHRQQCHNTLAQHVYPTLGDLPVSQIGTAEVLKCLEPIWHTLPVTATRVRNRLAQVLDWAAARDLRSHDNPAKRPKLLPAIKRQASHLAAVGYADVPSFLIELHKQDSAAARAIKFIVLTGVRLNECLGARWCEISGDVWTIPAERMKGGKSHRVPLSQAARAVLEQMPRDSDLIFHHPKHPDRRLHHSKPLQVLRSMGRSETVHGFRSAFRDWCRERTNVSREIAELALAHANKDKTEAAYARGDALEQRRRLMEMWAEFCSSPPVKHGDVVVPLARA